MEQLRVRKEIDPYMIQVKYLSEAPEARTTLETHREEILQNTRICIQNWNRYSLSLVHVSFCGNTGKEQY